MDSIRIINFRSIVDSGEIKLNDLNLLIGQNSSGKSSFLRLFPMMKESAQHELMGPILWFDENYDFGSFQTALSRHGTSNDISFSFDWEHPERTSIDLPLGELIEVFPGSIKKGTKCHLSFSVSKKGERVYLSRLRFSTGKDYVLVCEASGYDSAVSVILNDEVINDGISCRWNYGTKSLLPVLEDSIDYRYIRSLTTNLLGIQKDEFRGFLFFLYEDEMIYKSDKDINRYLQRVMKEHKIKLDIDKSSPQYKKLSDSILLSSAKRFINYANEYISRFFNGTYYITPLRYNFIRYMRNRDLSIDYIESSGKNVLEYILSLNESDRESYSSFLKDTLGIQVSVVGDDNKSIEVTNSDGEKDNIVDVGYGFSQVLPIATTLWDRAYKKNKYGFEETIVIEQPEVHLHPAMQASLAKLFVFALNLAKARGKRLCLIIETHSSRLVNRIGRYIYNSNHSNNQIELSFPRTSASLFLFEKKGGITTIKQTEYDDNGRILDWPMGFLD